MTLPRFPALTIGARISLLVLVIAASVAMMGALVIAALASSAYSRDRFDAAHRQQVAALILAERTSDFSEEIAEALLFAGRDRADYVAARRRVQQAFARLRALVESDALHLEPGPVQNAEMAELARIDSVRGVQAELELTAERIFQLQAEGRRDEAIALFRIGVEQGRDGELQRQIDAIVREEQAEFVGVERRTDQDRAGLSLAVLVLSVSLLTISLFAGRTLFRAFVRPVQALSDAAAALSSGDLDYRVAHRGRDELDGLAARFNEMAVKLELHRNELMANRRNLEAKVVDRTRSLRAVNARLEEANARLEQLDRQRVIFLAEISHELRTPLSGIRGEAEVAIRNDGPYADALERIVEQSADMAEFVEDLLFLARSETGEVRIDRVAVLVEDVIAGAVRDAHLPSLAKAIPLEIACEPGLVVRGDARRLRQVLLILLSNAVQYSPAGATVDVEARDVEDAVEFIVRDRGAGIAEHDLPHVFERFRRGTRASAVRPGGSGLGLAIAKWIVERHDGTIALRCQDGVTEAVVRLPRGGKAQVGVRP